MNDIELIEKQMVALLATMTEICEILHRIDLAMVNETAMDDRQERIPHTLITQEDYE